VLDVAASDTWSTSWEAQPAAGRMALARSHAALEGSSLSPVRAAFEMRLGEFFFAMGRSS
jgi:hypothetical protein